MLAIKHLSNAVRPHILPLIDVAAPTKTADQAKAVKYVTKNIGRTATLVGGHPAVLVDSSELDPDFRLEGEKHPLTLAADAVASAGVRAIAVTGLHRDAAHHAAACEIAMSQEVPALCVRLDATDVSTATLTNKRLRDFIAAATIGPSNVYVLLDLQCLFGQDVQSVSVMVTRLLRLLDNMACAGLIVGGYGFPDQWSQVCSTNNRAYLRRVEQDVFKGAVVLKLDTTLWFADYTVLSPSVVELDMRLIHKIMAPKAIYTLDDEWFVVRGGSFSSHPDGYQQYLSIADEIVALAEFSGAEYSYGDRYIWDRHLRQGTPGRPASWITACVNHHISLTADAYRAQIEG